MQTSQYEIVNVNKDVCKEHHERLWRSYSEGHDDLAQRISINLLIRYMNSHVD